MKEKFSCRQVNNQGTMQSELISQLNGIFSGKGHRKVQAVITPALVRKKWEGTGLFSQTLKEKFRRKSNGVSGQHIERVKQDGKKKTRRINLPRVMNLDFKLNLKRINFSSNPPALPPRHFIVSDPDDQPPPIPERKCSLDTSVNEEFQGRFVFRPLSTVPLPEEFTDCKKLYPSKTSSENVFQRPLSQPPPPPPLLDFLPSATEKKIIQDTTQDVAPSPQPLSQIDHPSLALSSNIMNEARTQDKNLHMFLSKDAQNCTSNARLPPPPSRPLPPLPVTSAQNVLTMSTFTISSVAPKVPPEQPSSNTSSQSIPLSRKPLTLNVSSEQIKDSNYLPATPPRSPPPLPTRPVFPDAGTKTNLVNGLPNRVVLKPSPNDISRMRPPAVIMKSKEKPSLPFENSTMRLEAKKLPPKPSTADSVNKNGAKILPQSLASSVVQQQPLLQSRPALSAQPSLVPPFPTSMSMSVLPQQDRISFANHPNKHRPLPSVPTKVNDGWGGAYAFDPRDEDGDIYDLMDSTDM